ncbi:rCG59068 [Rattus norvegicus]|uniref:RCG59068 n=1 Tax=Rattus norvegicus TaxID=10116 RepID=A6JPN8_RAT|nr:rCG59068 [Rattus norvegicus]
MPFLKRFCRPHPPGVPPSQERNSGEWIFIRRDHPCSLGNSWATKTEPIHSLRQLPTSVILAPPTGRRKAKA